MGRRTESIKPYFQNRSSFRTGMRFAYPLSISTPSAMNHIRSSKCTNIIFIIFRTGTENFAVSLLLAAEINFPTHPQPGISTVPYGPARPGTARLGSDQARPGLGRSHTPCFTLPPQKTCRTNTGSPQVGLDPLRLPGPTASTRPGPARAIFVDSDNSLLSWVTPIRFAPIDLVSGARGTPTNGWPI